MFECVVMCPLSDVTQRDTELHNQSCALPVVALACVLATLESWQWRLAKHLEGGKASTAKRIAHEATAAGCGEVSPG